MSESLTHSFPRSFLVVALYTSAVGFADTLWLCPERALRRLFALVSLLAPVALSPLLHRVFPDGFRLWCAFRFCEGASPLALVPWGPLGSCGGSTYIALHRTWLVSSFLQGALAALVGVFCLLCGIPPVFMEIIWSVSLTPACPLLVTPLWGCSLDTCIACDWLALLSYSTLFQDSVICAGFWSRQYGPHTTCERLRWVSLVYGGFDPLLLRCAWWSSRPGWLLNFSLTGTSVWAFLPWTCAVLEAGLTYRPLLALPRLCLLLGL